MSTNTNIVLIHRGGLGDFIMAWPAMLQICSQFPSRRIFWLGPESRLLWLRPLGVEPCPLKPEQLVNSLFENDDWPEELEDTDIFWFVLNNRPPVPEHPSLHVLAAIPQKSDAEPAMPLIPPREVYARHVARLGFGWNPHWPRAWRCLFGRSSTRASSGSDGGILIFPGAGHLAKQWPVVQFLELGRWLAEQGRAVHFVLGPAEMERGMNVLEFPVITPKSLEELQEIVLDAELVVGNDSGPLHLAGMLDVPGVVLFGPASEAQWGPLGLRSVSLNYPCRPCTQTGRISCENPLCMLELPQEMVRREIAFLLKSSEVLED